MVKQSYHKPNKRGLKVDIQTKVKLDLHLVYRVFPMVVKDFHKFSTLKSRNKFRKNLKSLGLQVLMAGNHLYQKVKKDFKKSEIDLQIMKLLIKREEEHHF